MRVVAESTEVFVDVQGRRCRVWKAVTERGVPCSLLVAVVAVEMALDQSEFAHELKDQVTLDPAVSRTLTEMGQ